jgi:hypothetical protein
MIRFTKSMAAWNTPAFQESLKQEIATLDERHLPLQQGLTASSRVSDSPIQAIILNVAEEAEGIRVKAGIFYKGVIAGCNCADDPSPIDEQNEYCVVQFMIDRLTAEASVTLFTE